MINYTNSYPLGIGEQWSRVYIGDWDHNTWSTHEKELLEWLDNEPDNSRYSWERPAHTFCFEKKEAAMWFILRWAS